MLVSINDLLDKDVAIKNVAYAANDFVVPPVPTLCESGDKVFSRLFFIKRGSIVFCEEPGQKPYLKGMPGEILYIPYDCTYYSYWECGETGAYETIVFTLWDGAERLDLSEKAVVLVKKEQNVYSESFSEMRREWKEGMPGYRLGLKAKLYSLLKSIAVNRQKNEVKAKYRSIYKGIMAIENNYLEDISISHLAAVCHVSEGTFRRLFAEYKGETPVKYRNMLRIKKAEELLLSGEYTVTEAAEACAVPDVAYFSKMFKKIMGFSPSDIIK